MNTVKDLQSSSLSSAFSRTGCESSQWNLTKSMLETILSESSSDEDEDISIERLQSSITKAKESSDSEFQPNVSSALSGTFRVPPPKTLAQSKFVRFLSGEYSNGVDDQHNNVVDEEFSDAKSKEAPPLSCQSRSFELKFRMKSSEQADDILLAIVWSNDRLGAAYYNVVTSELFVMNDTVDDTTDFNLMKAVYKQCKPRYVITITGGFAMFLNTVKKLVLTELLDEEQNCSLSNDQSFRVALKMMPKKEYSYERCWHRVRCLQLQCEPENATASERITFLNGILNFQCHAMIHALGLLLLYIDKQWNNIALVLSGKAPYLSLDHVALEDLVMVDEDTYKALKIVERRYHPRLFKFGSASIETQEVNLFMFLNHCRSLPGEQFLWKTLHHPTRNIRVLDQRFDVIEFFLHPSNQSVVEHLSSYLKHIYRITYRIFDRYTGLQAKVPDLYKLYKTISHVVYIADVCDGYTERIELFKRIVEGTTDGMRYVKYFIEYVVDFAASRRENKFMIKQNVDPLLDELNHVKTSLPELLTQMGQRDMQEHLPDSVADCSMVYLPNIGYVLGVKEWNPTPPEDTIIPSLEYKFTVNGVRYYKSPSAKELDNTIGDVVMKVTKRQNEIMLKLMRFINKHAVEILRAIRLCAELDTLLAYYTVARNYNFIRPKMVEEQVISITECRHPLQELLTSFVPNDIKSGAGNSHVKILTGLNCCGKSTYLKQIGLVVFMAHIGCYVPARSATIGVLTHIFTQIVTTDSVALSTSTFLQDLRQINVAIRSSTPNSLIIIDEFGKATSEVSGLSLLAAVLNTFIERGKQCPHVFVATHILRVMKLIPRNPLVEAQTFEYLVNDDESLTFMYRVKTGSATYNFASSVAKGAGLAEKLVKRSLEVFEKMKDGKVGPDRLSDVQHRDTARYIVERVVVPNKEFDLDELKSWVRQAVIPTLNKK